MKKFLRLIYFLVLIITVLSAVYIMANKLGLNDSLDFGAGAYYYADMPGFEKWFEKDFYISQTPAWILILLFLTWGAFIYRLWLLLDKKLLKN